MEDIKNYNCDGLCIQRYCDEKYTKFTVQTINGMESHLAFCDKHAEEFENAELKKLKNVIFEEVDKSGRDGSYT